jgi:hypothetical protein
MRRHHLTLFATSLLVLTSAVSAAVTATADSRRVVSYAGRTVEVPVGWRVIDYRNATTGCVRLDQQVVYVGTPKYDDCPARVIGRAQAIWLRPSTPTTAATRSTTVAAGGGSVHVVGEGFDKCTAAPTSQMRAWLASPMRSVNIYIGGANRGCSQALLTAAWVTTVASNGWSLIPTYVGLQAPCTTHNYAKIDATDPGTSGTQDATDAINQMQNLGLGPNNIVYNDMESYSDDSAHNCANAVTSYLSAWTTTLHAAGFLSGVYSSAATGMTNLQNFPPNPAVDDIWIAHWDGKDTTADGNGTTSDPTYVPSTYYPSNRLRQYLNDARINSRDKTFGGFAFSIDKDVLDGDAALPAMPAAPTGPPYNFLVSGSSPEFSNGLTEYAAPTSSSAQVGTIAEGGQLAVQCQTHGLTVHGDSVWDKLADANNGYVSDLYTTTTGGITWMPGLPRCDTTVPTITLNPVPMATLSGAPSVSWTASDDDSGVASYVLRYRSARTDGRFGGYRTIGGITASHYTLAMSPGYDVCVQVAAVDYDGNMSPYTHAQCVTRPLDDRSLTASTGWSRGTGTGYYLSTYTLTKSSSKTLRLPSATLDRVGIVATKCPSCGTVDVYVGTTRVARFSLYATRTLRQQILIARPFTATSSSVRVISRSSGKTIVIDGLFVSIT